MVHSLKNEELSLLGYAEGTGTWYIYRDGEWQELGLKNHSHNGVNLDLTETHIKLTHIKIENGIITEFTGA